jgi:hypothetical protein
MVLDARDAAEEVSASAVRLVAVVVARVVRPVTTMFVDVELPMMRFVKLTTDATRLAKNPFVAVIPVVDALPSSRLTSNRKCSPYIPVLPLTERAVAEAVATELICPVTS